MTNSGSLYHRGLGEQKPVRVGMSNSSAKAWIAVILGTAVLIDIAWMRVGKRRPPMRILP